LLKNFAEVNEIQIDLNDDITYLIGENGSGKTICGLNAVWFVLEGIAKTGKKVLHADRFRFIGKYGKSAIGQITLYDEKEDIEIYLQRKMTKSATTLEIAASDGRDLGPNFVDKIFNIFSINPEGFAQLTPKEQAVILGVDTTDIEAKKSVVYEQRKEQGYAVKQLHGAITECGDVEKAENIDIKKLLDKKNKLSQDNKQNFALAQEQREALYQEATAHNEKQSALQRMRLKTQGCINGLMTKIKELQREIEKASVAIKKEESNLEKMPEAKPLMGTNIPLPKYVEYDTSNLDETIERAQENNRKAVVWTEFENLKQKHKKATATHVAKDAEYKKLEDERVKYLKSRDLPFSNVTINDKGELLVDGRPFCSPYFSKGEILRAGIKMAASKETELKYIFVPDAQSIDEASREVLFAELISKGFQVVAEMVGTKKKDGDNSILLKESRIVESYGTAKNIL
jgi:DNA repair exonuclease SbcCD ATPase subunit